MIDWNGRVLERREPGEDPYVLGVNSYEEPARRLSFCVKPTFADILRYYDRAERIAVGVPIGLPEGRDERRCDVEARQKLGPRAAAVFRVPVRPAAYAESFAAALFVSRERCRKGIFNATWAFCPRIVEVDRVMRPEVQERVFEAHREVCFWGLNGKRAMRHNKTTPEGYEERRELLSVTLCRELAKREVCNSRVLGVDPDRLLDTAAAALTAYRAFQGKSENLPREPEMDGKGLRMEMVY
jgi:predicted RNase H-like nuclease